MQTLNLMKKQNFKNGVLKLEKLITVKYLINF